MSSETSASETTPLRWPESRSSESFPTTTAAPTRNSVGNALVNTSNASLLTQYNTTASLASPNKNNIEVQLSYTNNNSDSFPSRHSSTTIRTTTRDPQQQQQRQQIQQHPQIQPQLQRQQQQRRSRSSSSPNTMDTNKRILCRVGIDFLILLCVGFPILGFYLWGESYKRGFFCDDESLKHPFKDSTVRNWMLYCIGLVIPVTVMFTVELIRSQRQHSKPSSGRRYVFMDYEIPDWLVECYKKIGIFVFGAAVCQLTTDIAKYSIGRLRPHFFAVCQPQMNDGTTCADPVNAGRYIVDFTCAGIGSTARMLREVHLSFPSGHSSFTFFTMVYVALYLQSRMRWRGSKLLRHLLQFLFIMIAWYTALSRISDYKHHWSDVLAGSAIGALSAIIVANYVSDLFRGDNAKSYVLPRTLNDSAVPQTITANGR